MKWFNPTPVTLEDLKKMYKTLAYANHPDRGGRTEDMQEINNEYDRLFARLKNVRRNKAGEVYTTTEEVKETPEQYRAIIDKLIHFENCLIEICGTWIWVSGNTKVYKDILKELKFRFSKNKAAWYYHSEPYVKRSKTRYSLDDIRTMWGSQEVETEEQARITA